MKTTARKPSKASQIMRDLKVLKQKVLQGEMIEVDQVTLENSQLIIKRKKMPADEFFRDSASNSPVLHGMSGEEVQGIRKKLGLSQAAFARWLAAGRGTVRQWEQKTGIHAGPGLRLLHLIKSDLPGWRHRIRQDLMQKQMNNNLA